MVIKYNVICVGAGGTGGNFAKEFARYIAGLSLQDTKISFALVDGDKVESGNRSRQPFTEDDVEEYKSVALVEAIQDVFNLDNVFAYASYLDTSKDLENIYIEQSRYLNNRRNNLPNEKEIIILIGCVDNHRARQVLDQFFYEYDNIIYIDSANEFSVGEICIGARFNNKTIAPPRSYYFPDILTDTSPSASEMSCSEVNVSSPQHIATNLMAAHLVLSVVANVISHKKVDCGIIYFDSFKYFSRFDKFEETNYRNTNEEGEKMDG